MADFNLSYYKSPTNPLAIGECTWYCYGRALEVTKGKTKAPNVGPGQKYLDAMTGTKKDKNTMPTGRGIAVYTTHVLFIESVSGDKITYTEANWYVDKAHGLSDGKINADDGKTKTMTGLAALQSKCTKSGGSYVGWGAI